MSASTSRKLPDEALAHPDVVALLRLGKAVGETQGQNFGALLKDAIGSVLEAGKASDAQQRAMVAGKANIVDVVTAVSETEVAVEALVSVRDRMIQAYEEIMRMPI